MDQFQREELAFRRMRVILILSAVAFVCSLGYFACGFISQVGGQ